MFSTLESTAIYDNSVPPGIEHTAPGLLGAPHALEVASMGLRSAACMLEIAEGVSQR